jgi:hypothetical protein
VTARPSLDGVQDQSGITGLPATPTIARLIEKIGRTYPVLGGEVFRRTALPRLILWRENLLPPIQIAAAAEQDHDHYDDQKDS